MQPGRSGKCRKRYIAPPDARFDQRNFDGICRTILFRTALEWMGTPDDVIDLAALYMKIYFIGMPFFHAL